MKIVKLPIHIDYFPPHHLKYPALLYKKAILVEEVDEITVLLHDNGWKRSWVDGIYDYHHFHSNTHEVLCVFKGVCELQLGGEKGKLYKIEKGDVVVLPAGTSHKNLDSSDDFICVGAYPSDIEYDMHDGIVRDAHLWQKIEKVPLPETDPVYGKDGPLFQYWKS